MTTNADWLARTHEEPLAPELPIVDPHHHLWDDRRGRYLLDDLRADAAPLNVRETVYLECGAWYRPDGPVHLRPVGETEWVERLATAVERDGAWPRVAAAIVAHADLQLGAAVGEVLDAHLAASPRVRGVRHHATWDASDDVPQSRIHPPPHLLADAEFRAGLAQLEQRGMSFDAWVYHPQLPEVTDLARARPGLTIVLNHLGGPIGVGPYAGRREEVFADWSRDMSELATCPNVYVKLGGIQMPLNGHAWSQRDRPPSSDELVDVNGAWYRHAIDAFGPARCMFESNFPVDRLACSYTVLWNQFEKLTADLSPDDRAAVFGGAARAAYRLDG